MVVMFLLVFHGVYKPFVQSTTPPRVQSIITTSSKPPPDSRSPCFAPRGGRCRYRVSPTEEVPIISSIESRPPSPREYISRSLALPIGAHNHPGFSNGAEEASPHLQRPPDATLRVRALLQELSIAATEVRFVVCGVYSRWARRASSSNLVCQCRHQGVMAPTVRPV
jgi:hypothetical protein